MSRNVGLSEVERQQLDSPDFVSHNQWLGLRHDLVAKSFAANALLKDETMLAYTPGETRDLLGNLAVRRWHEYVDEFRVPDDYDNLVLVPCAKTKPWDYAHSRRSQLYRGYHEVIRASDNGDIAPTYFATISEPLGVVPQQDWADFPQYDNPGLFRDPYLRAGLMSRDFVARFGERKKLPFDDEAYQYCIHQLGSVVARFLRVNSDKNIYSFVDTVGTQSTHQEMLDYAVNSNPDISVFRYTKRSSARTSPAEFIISKLSE